MQKRTPGSLGVLFLWVGMVSVKTHQLIIFKLSAPKLNRSTGLPFFWISLTAVILFAPRGCLWFAHPATHLFNAGRKVV